VKPGSPARWLVVSVLPPLPGQEPLLVDALKRLGARAVERDGQRYAARFPPPERVTRLMRDVEAAFLIITGLPDAGLSWHWQDHSAWAAAWTAAQTERVGPRMVVARTDGPVPGATAGDLVIRLEPTTAFGTAEHPTTRACLRLLHRLVRPGDALADLGTGSGILAIAAALLGARRILALDADPLACDAARVNSALNGTGDRIRVRHRLVRPGRFRRLGPFDGIVANLEAGTIVPLLPDLTAALRPGGWAAVSGVVEPEAVGVTEAARDAGLDLVERAVDEGWWTGHLRLRGADPGSRLPGDRNLM
jgi:ribosomal protein L11 methyltransferase